MNLILGINECIIYFLHLLTIGFRLVQAVKKLLLFINALLGASNIFQGGGYQTFI